jgi:hypothetical protein
LLIFFFFGPFCMVFLVGEKEKKERLQGDEYDDHCHPCGATGPEIPYALYVNLWFDLLKKDMHIMNYLNT